MHKVIDITQVTKIEIAVLRSEADMFIYEIYYINRLKPSLNRDDKSPSDVTVFLPELDFREYKPPRMEIWVKDIIEIEKAEKAKKLREKERADKKREMRRILKGDAYYEWLEANGY